MALPINIDDLLSKQKVESNRIEFKAGWNPSSIYHSICAFANDIDNLGGGYILVGVEEENGVAVRPVKGLEDNQLDKIQREMLQFNAMMDPIYYPRISVEEIDERKILVIWVTSGHNRPYTAPADVTAKLKKPVFYIRYGTSSIEAKGENLDRLRDMANRVPYDDRGNEDISVDDISPLLVKAHLASIGSKLAKADFTSDMEKILEQMELLDGPKEKRLVKNVGRENNPDNFIEIPAITGPVPMMIRDTLNYLRTNIVKERIIKPTDNEKSIKVYNYPFQSLEEAVVNALYHRDYKEREPVEITIEPDKISILSYSGPDRSISLESIKEAKSLRSRRYRNRRLGEFLKELDLTEGRATGIPTIQKKLLENGSPKATIETDESRSYFLIDIPCRKDFVQDNNVLTQIDIQRVTRNLMVKCPRYVQDMSKIEIEHLAVCILKSRSAVSAQIMLEGGDKISYKQKRRKYLDKLLEMRILLMTIPEKPTSRNQQYTLSEYGKDLLE